MNTKALYFALSLWALQPTTAQTLIKDCPAVIKQPGLYQLAQDMMCGKPVAITIAASNVTLNLNRHKLFGGIKVAADETVNPPQLSHVTIHGPGLVLTINNGIELTNVFDSEVAHVTIAAAIGILATGVSRLNVTGNTTGGGGMGIGLYQSGNSSITGNDASSNTVGIFAGGGFSNTIANNTTNGNLEDGIRIHAETGIRVSGNTANANHLNGIRIQRRVQGGTATLVANRALVNFIDDMSEEFNTCTGDQWRNNTFFTSNAPGCIQ